MTQQLWMNFLGCKWFPYNMDFTGGRGWTRKLRNWLSTRCTIVADSVCGNFPISQSKLSHTNFVFLVLHHKKISWLILIIFFSVLFVLVLLLALLIVLWYLCLHVMFVLWATWIFSHHLLKKQLLFWLLFKFKN